MVGSCYKCECQGKGGLTHLKIGSLASTSNEEFFTSSTSYHWIETKEYEIVCDDDFFVCKKCVSSYWRKRLPLVLLALVFGLLFSYELYVEGNVNDDNSILLWAPEWIVVPFSIISLWSVVFLGYCGYCALVPRVVRKEIIYQRVFNLLKKRYSNLKILS